MYEASLLGSSSYAGPCSQSASSLPACRMTFVLAGLSITARTQDWWERGLLNMPKGDRSPADLPLGGNKTLRQDIQ